jgi:hypothetical protein
MILEAFPQASVMVRVFDRRQAMALEGLDVKLLQRELFDSAVAMGRAALASLGHRRTRSGAGRARIS